jgi:hypothetical protein
MDQTMELLLNRKSVRVYEGKELSKAWFPLKL